MNRVKVLAVPGQVNGLKCSERRAKIRVVSMRLTTAIKILAMVRNLTYLKLTYNLPPMSISMNVHISVINMYR